MTFLSINIKCYLKTRIPNKEKRLVRKMPYPVTLERVAGVSTE